MAGPATVEALGLGFTEAIDYLRDKVDLPTERWTDLWHGMHARAFVVAGATKAALLEDFHQAITAAIAEGATLADFRRDFARITAQHGWDFRGGAKWRAGVIFNTNLRMAYAAGKWAQIERLAEARPWLRYVAVLDDRTRDEHRQWHDTILPADHPFWSTHYPPNGWNCRCTVQQLSDDDLERYGLRPSTEAPRIKLERRDLEGGGRILVPEGIDSGFGYHVGHAAWGRGAMYRRLAASGQRPGEMLDLVAPGVPQVPPARMPPVPVDPPTAPFAPRSAMSDEASTRAAWRDALGGVDEAIWTDPSGTRIQVGPAVVDHILEDPKRRAGRVPYFPVMQDVIERPFEIWTGWAHDRAGKVSLRRRYVKQVADADTGRSLTLVVDAVGGQWAGLTYFHSHDPSSLNKSRRGLLIYRRES